MPKTVTPTTPQKEPLLVLKVPSTQGGLTMHRFLLRAKPGHTGCGKDAKGAKPEQRSTFVLKPEETDTRLCGWCDRVIKQESPERVAERLSARRAKIQKKKVVAQAKHSL